MDLAAILRQAIKDSGLTQHALAEKSGVPQPRISGFINGGTLQLDYTGKLMDALGLKLTGKLLTKRAKKA